MQKWIEEFNRFLPIKSQIILYGNIHDAFYVGDKGFRQLKQTIEWCLNSFIGQLGSDTCKQYDVIAFYDIADGVTFSNEQMRSEFRKISLSPGTSSQPTPAGRSYEGPSSGAETIVGPTSSEGSGTLLLPRFCDAAAAFRNAVSQSEKAFAGVVMWANNVISNPGNTFDIGERRGLVYLSKAAVEGFQVSGEAGRYPNSVNKIVIVTETLDDLPVWVCIGNPHVKTIQIGTPDSQERMFVFDMEFASLHGAETLVGKKQEEAKDLLVGLTDGMTNYDLHSLCRMSETSEISVSDPKALVNTYIYGKTNDPWAKLDKSRIEAAPAKLKERVMGQDRAVDAVVDMLIRAQTGLAGTQHSGGKGRPRGVLFFVGPTGVGKTELAKALAELLFGDENQCIRFDMSEYATEHSAEKFIGAPPGYVGYDQGGQLTNKVKEKPFSVLLFDEVEKAHGKILDKFLQILDDGRLTDGKGETVYFSDSIIVFTSNIGSEGLMGSADDPKSAPILDKSYEELTVHYDAAVRYHFINKLQRPELLGRLGEGIIVFDRLREEVVEPIIRKALNGTKRWANNRQITLNYDDRVVEYIKNEAEINVAQGGRGVNNKVEQLVITPLSRFVFWEEPLPGSTILVKYDPQEGIAFNIV